MPMVPDEIRTHVSPLYGDEIACLAAYTNISTLQIRGNEGRMGKGKGAPSFLP